MSQPNDWRTRIICDASIHHGEPTIRGTRIAVAVLVASLTDLSIEAILKHFPQLTRDDIDAAILFTDEEARKSLV